MVNYHFIRRIIIYLLSISISILFLHLYKKNDFRIPKLQLEKAKGLSKVQIGALEKELLEKAEEFAKKGEEVILELVQMVESFLYDNNKPASVSFYEEMLIRQKREQELIAKARKIQEDKEVFFADMAIKSNNVIAINY